MFFNGEGRAFPADVVCLFAALNNNRSLPPAPLSGAAADWLYEGYRAGWGH